MDNVATLIREGKLEQVENELNRRRGEASNNADWHYSWGLLEEARGQVERAVDSFRQALTIDQNHAKASFRLAYNLDLRGEDDEAMDLYDSLSCHTPTYVNALINLAVLHEDRGNYEEAYRCIQRVLFEHPNHSRARLFLKDIQSSMSMQYDEDYERNMQKRNALLDTPVSDFELTVRARNCLKKMNINTLGDLLRVTEPELLGYKNFGETSLNEIKAMLKQKGLRLGQLREEAGQSAPGAAARKPGSDSVPEVYHKSLSEIELSGRSRKCLQRLNLVTIGDLVQKTEAELLATKNFGQTSLMEIKQRLEELGVSLRG